MWWADIEVPNLAVDMNSWARSACYPRRTFYSLSDGPSIWNHRITMTDFRLCSTCRSRSQASFCHYTLKLISVQFELTIARLRYSLGGDRPSQTTHHTVFQTTIKPLWLEIKNKQRGISLTTPPKLTPELQSLPHILHSAFLISV
jgi:hypothetical protein